MTASRSIVIVSLALSFAAAQAGDSLPAGAASPRLTNNPDFFWQPPTVPVKPPATGPFDATALDSLAVEICALDASRACVSGAPVDRLTSAATSPNRIALDNTGEFYTVHWLAAAGKVSSGQFYRARVLRESVEIGAIDVAVVDNATDLAAVALPNIGVIRGQALTLRFRIQIPTARTRVVINEVESSGGLPGDWVELYNTAPVPLSLAGYVIKDNDDSHAYTLPPSATIPAGGYLVVEEPDLTYGLGAGDAVRLYDPSGNLFDSYTWTAHAATTYGRCPNGAGAFATTTIVTKGAANDCGSPVRINEVESSGGVPGDWVELFNAGSVPFDLSGYIFRDNDDTHKYVIPQATIIQPGAYYMLEEADFGFGLGAADSARLSDPSDTQIDSYTWTAHATTTYGRCPNGSGGFITTTSVTKGAANDCAVAVKLNVQINEISSGGVSGDWVELYNAGSAPADISGFVFLNGDIKNQYFLPNATVIPPGGYFVLEQAAFGFDLVGDDTARMYDLAGVLVDSYSWRTQPATTYGRCANGTGPFTTTVGPTKGAANNCGGSSNPVRINEVESSGGVPGDWIELYNAGSTTVDISGWKILDNDDTHTPSVLPPGTTIAPGGFYIVEEAALGFGLGAADSARLFSPAGVLLESYSWTAHASTTYGRCPDGAGEFTTTSRSTKGAQNSCTVNVKINEVESNGGVPGDWVELYNAGSTSADISGYVFLDNDLTHQYFLPAGTVIPPGGYYILDEAAFGFGLGGADTARLYDLNGALVDTYSWETHAVITYGRCPDGVGEFADTSAPTKGTANACSGGGGVGAGQGATALAWPGDANVQTVDGLNVFAGNLSGLIYEPSGGTTIGTLWGIRNGPGSLFRLIWNGSIWTPDPSSGWSAGKLLAYANGTGSPDSEGLTFTDQGPSAGIYVATERDNNNSGVSRPTVLRYDPSSTGTGLTATHEWNLTSDLPVVGANLGVEGITWIPDSFLISRGFLDENKGRPYDPAQYPNHGTGLFFVGLEANGMVYAYALDHTGGGYTRIATFTSGFPGVMDLQFDREQGDLWAVCDDTCQGRTGILRIDTATGKFAVARQFERPAQMPNLNNEGFAFAPLAECVNNRRPAFWSDDSETGGHGIRRGTLACTPF